MKKKATTKRERKYGKKESKELEEITKKPKKNKKEDMYKILVDGYSFIGPFTKSKCEDYINKQNKRAEDRKGTPPMMTLVKV